MNQTAVQNVSAAGYFYQHHPRIVPTPPPRRPTRGELRTIAILAYAAVFHEAWHDAPPARDAGPDETAFFAVVWDMSREVQRLALAAIATYGIRLSIDQEKTVDAVTAAFQRERNGGMRDAEFLNMVIGLLEDSAAVLSRRKKTSILVVELLEALHALYAQIDPDCSDYGAMAGGHHAAQRLRAALGRI